MKTGQKGNNERTTKNKQNAKSKSTKARRQDRDQSTQTTQEAKIGSNGALLPAATTTNKKTKKTTSSLDGLDVVLWEDTCLAIETPLPPAARMVVCDRLANQLDNVTCPNRQLDDIGSLIIVERLDLWLRDENKHND